MASTPDLKVRIVSDAQHILVLRQYNQIFAQMQVKRVYFCSHRPHLNFKGSFDYLAKMQVKGSYFSRAKFTCFGHVFQVEPRAWKQLL